jgi:AraC-like DNA-binding protein
MARTEPRTKRPHVDVDRVRVPAFAVSDDLDPFEGDAHVHRVHQILYAAEGALHLETDEGSWLLPPQRGAVIAAGVRHRTSATQPVALRTVYLSRRLLSLDVSCRVFAASPLAREMILFAMRWGPDRGPRDPLAASFFRTLGGLAARWIEEGRDFHLPTPRSEDLRRATTWLLAHLEDATVEGAAKAARTSVRTLTRRFGDELQTTVRDWLRAARMLRAMDLLAQPDARVTEVALAVGFESPSAFTAAFVAFTGDTPRSYLRAKRRHVEPHMEKASP